MSKDYNIYNYTLFSQILYQKTTKYIYFLFLFCYQRLDNENERNFQQRVWYKLEILSNLFILTTQSKKNILTKTAQ